MILRIGFSREVFKVLTLFCYIPLIFDYLKNKLRPLNKKGSKF